MVIYFEGLRCSGKTTLINGYDNSHVIKIFRSLPKQLHDPQPTMFMMHDEQKCSIAHSHSADTLVLVDRSYLSTAVFYTVMQEVDQSFSVWPIYNWLLNGLDTTLKRPDCYIFVDTPINICVERAKATRTFDSCDVWITKPERIVYWYERLFASFEHNVPLYRLNGVDEKDVVQTQLNDLLDYLFQEHCKHNY